MILSDSDIRHLLNLAILAAKQAGYIIAHNTSKSVTIQRKNTGSSEASKVVTEIDRLSQSCILNCLSESINTFDLGILTEELTDDKSRFEKDYFWCIDPLDGTLPYIEQRSGYSVSIALVSKSGKSILGVIYNPQTDCLYAASLNNGAYKNGKKWHLKKNTGFTMICDRSFLDHPDYSTVLNSYIGQINTSLNIINHGGAAMNAMWVIEYAPAEYIKLPKKQAGGGSVWDFAASSCIAIEMGIIASDYNLGELNFNTKSTYMNKKGIRFSSK